MRTLLARSAFVLLVAMLVPIAWGAAPVTYTGTAPVNSQSEADRVGALQTALANVVITRTGDSSVIARADVAKAVSQAERYVLQYQYKNNTDPDAAAKMTLVAQFDSNAVDRMLGQLGIGAAGAVQSAQPAAPSEATVWISGIADANDYARVIGYLAKNNFVRSAQPTAAHSDGILVKLSLVTDLAGFLDAVGLERTLTVATATPADGADATLALVR